MVDNLGHVIGSYTVQSIYNTHCYNKDFDITWSCYGSMEFYKGIIGKKTIMIIFPYLFVCLI